jgi:hypothetical protein
MTQTGDSRNKALFQTSLAREYITHYTECITARREGLQRLDSDFWKEKGCSDDNATFCSPYQQRLSGMGGSQ